MMPMIVMAARTSTRENAWDIFSLRGLGRGIFMGFCVSIFDQLVYQFTIG